MDCGDNCIWAVNQYDGNLVPNLNGVGPLKLSTTYTPIISVHSQFDMNNGKVGNIKLSCTGEKFVTKIWFCRDGIQNISATFVCNNPTKPDCNDGSDEDDLTCMGGLNIYVVLGIGLHFILGLVFVIPSKCVLLKNVNPIHLNIFT